jgi:hypothetical protein
MRVWLLCPLLLVLLLPSTSAGQDVRYNFDRQVDFSLLKTYKWVVIQGASPLNELTDRQVKAVIDVELSKKGLSLSETEYADVHVGYQAAVQTEKELSTFSVGVGYGPGWYPGWYGGSGAMVRGQTSTIYIGELTLDFYAPSPQYLVWRGVVSKTLDTDAKPDRQQRNLERAVAKLLRNFPPPVKK